MIISSKKKFIFIHISKNAGTAITDSLKEYDNNKFKNFFRIIDRKLTFHNQNKGKAYNLPIIKILNIFFPLKYKYFRIHERLKTIPIKFTKNYFKFAVFRDPMERFYSIYNFALQRKHDLLFKIASKGLENFTEKMLSNEIEINNQIDFIKNENGEIDIDYLINYQTLDKDYEIICNKLQLNIKSLDKINTGKYLDKNKLSSNMLDKVKDRFKEDIYIFNNISKYQTLK